MYSINKTNVQHMKVPHSIQCIPFFFLERFDRNLWGYRLWMNANTYLTGNAAISNLSLFDYNAFLEPHLKVSPLLIVTPV